MPVRYHYVYCLFVADVLSYVGRSITPTVRKGVFERNNKLSTTMMVSAPLKLKEAQELELLMIGQLRPRYNKYVASSPTRLGMKNSRAHKNAISRAMTGRHLTEEHKKKLWATRDRSAVKGFPHTEKTKKKLRKAVKAQFADPVKRERHRMAVQAWFADPLNRKKLSEGAKRRCARSKHEN